MAGFFSGGGTDQQTNQSGSQFGTSTPSFGGNLSFFEQGFPNLFQPQGQEQDFLNSIQGLSGKSRYTPQMDWGMQHVRGLLGNPSGNVTQTDPNRIARDLSVSGAESTLQRLMDTMDPTAINAIMQQLQSAQGGLNPYELQGLETMRGRTDPRALTDASMRYFQDIVEPSARAGLQAGGFGGTKGGAYAETLGREGSRMALPISQMIQQALGEYGGAQMGMGGTLENRRMSLASLLEQMRMGQSAEMAGLANQKFGIRNAFTNQEAGLAGQLYNMGSGDSRMSDLGILDAGRSAAAQPRLGALQDFMRQQQLAQLQRGMSTTGNTSGTGSSSSQTPFTLKDLLGPLSSVAASTLLARPETLQMLKSLFQFGGQGGGGLGTGVDPSQFPNMVDVAPEVGTVYDVGSSGVDYGSDIDWGSLL